MDHLIIFLLVITMYFGLNEACKKNHVVIHNELAPGTDLNIACREFSIERTPTRFHTLKFKDPFYIIEFADNNQLPHGEKWYCLLSHGTRPKYWYDIEVYRQGAYPRCGQLRSWIAKMDGIWFTRRYDSPPGHVLNWKIQ